MSTQKYFQDLLTEKLNLSDKDKGKVQVHNELRDSLKEAFLIKADGEDGEIYSFLTGSYARNTIISPPKDVDFFIVVPESLSENSPSELLHAVYEQLEILFPENNITQQTHSVTLEYDPEFSIDIIPAIEISDELYKIPEVVNGEESWLESNPKIHQEILTTANEKTDGILVPLVKILKYWKKQHFDEMKSFHIEMLAVKILGDESIPTFSEGLCKFFQESGKYIDGQCLPDPANPKNYIDDYLSDDEKGSLKMIISQMALIAEAALRFEKDSEDDESATEKWGELFAETKSQKIFAKHEPHEKNITFLEELKYKLKITSKIFNNTKNKYLEQYSSGSRKLPKSLSLKFYADTANIPLYSKLYWQIVNTGTEAEANDDLRGDILEDKGKKNIIETTKYMGTHYVNCFAVLNGKCVAKDRFYVKII